MNEKSEAIKGYVRHILGEQSELGYELLQEQWPSGATADSISDRLDALPEWQAIDDICRVMSGELASAPNSSELELGEAANIAKLLAGHCERLVEIGQENEGYDGLIVVGATLESLSQSIDGLLQHNARKDGVS